MRKLLSIVITATLMMSCGTANKVSKVPYTIAHGYFVRNDAPAHASNFYDNRESFDRIFGCAAVMGPDGLPTDIDFSRQSVVAIIGNQTNCPTEYIPISVTSESDTLRLKYRATEAAPTTYTMTPLLLVVIDKQKASSVVKLEKN